MRERGDWPRSRVPVRLAKLASEFEVVSVAGGNLHMHPEVVVCSINDDELTAVFCSAYRSQC